MIGDDPTYLRSGFKKSLQRSLPSINQACDEFILGNPSESESN